MSFKGSSNLKNSIINLRYVINIYKYKGKAS